jgi:peptidyl-tRNA hydrolase, PTH2 family
MVEHFEIKQVIVIRKDLKMRRGKEIAQGSHGAMAFLSRSITYHLRMGCVLRYFRRLWLAIWGKDVFYLWPEAKDWLTSSFAKVVLQCESEEELLSLAETAKNVNLECHIITDSGKTEFGGFPTRTCLAIGPDRAEKIDEITGNLKLY